MKCFYCELEVEAITEDHVIALSKGGINHRMNRVKCCGPCNSLKGSLTLYKFLQKIEFHIKHNPPAKKRKVPVELLPLIKVNIEFLIVNRLLVHKEKLFKTFTLYDNY